MVQSKISLILDGGEPKIKMTCVDSEEIVDTVFKMFAEKFKGVSTLCQVEFKYPGSSKELLITPVDPDKLAETCSKILEAQPRAENFSFLGSRITVTGNNQQLRHTGDQLTGDQLTEMARPSTHTTEHLS